MANGAAFLVVGGDSLVGGGVVDALSRRGRLVYSSTRKTATLNAERLYLDFERYAEFKLPADVGYVYLVAAATSYDRCENDPLARITNVELIPAFVGSLLQRGTFVTFISTNTVFGGDQPWPDEDAPHDPRIAYARQKAEGEAAIRAIAKSVGAADRLAVVRLTKILAANVSPLPAWFAAWQRGEAIDPFADLIFAPMSRRFVGDALVKLGEKRLAGNLHLSGEANVSYVDFARALAHRMGIDESLIRPTTAVAKGIDIPFKPRFSGLGMTRTTQLSGIQPQRLEQVIDDLVPG